MLYDDVSLAHYGVKGMRWGIRNKKARANRAPAELPPKKINPRHLSDGDLKAMIDRMQMEKKFTELSKGGSTEGKKYAIQVLKNSGNAAAGAVVAGLVAKYIKTKFDADVSTPKKKKLPKVNVKSVPNLGNF